MATNEIFRDADSVTLPVPSGTVSGDPVEVGSLIGVALTSRDGDGNATVRRKGAFDLPTSDAVSAVGTSMYLASTGAITTTATDNTLFGYALATKASGAGSIPIAIAQV